MPSRNAKYHLACAVVLFLILSSSTAEPYSSVDCLACHARGGSSTRLVSSNEFRDSAHGKELSCTDCHTGIRDQSHQSRPGSGAVNCRQCHNQENRHGLRAGSASRPLCQDCHTRHGILSKINPQSSVHPDRLPATCQTCHPRESGPKDLLSRFAALRVKSHKKQDFSREFRDTNCLGCHQGQAAHGEENPLDAQTCFKCHQPRNGENPLWGSIHPRADRNKQPALWAAAVADQAGLGLLAAGVGFLIVRHFKNKRRKGS